MLTDSHDEKFQQTFRSVDKTIRELHTLISLIESQELILFQSCVQSLVGEIASGNSYLTGGPPVLFLAIPKGEEAIGITVRSPLGKVSKHEVPSGVSKLTLQLD